MDVVRKFQRYLLNFYAYNKRKYDGKLVDISIYYTVLSTIMLPKCGNNKTIKSDGTLYCVVYSEYTELFI